MQYRDDEVVYSLGSVSVSYASAELDTTSDTSIWVRQYMEWEAVAPAQREIATLGLKLQELASESLPVNLLHPTPKPRLFPTIGETRVAVVHA